jgi:hypothetical protein
MNHLRNRILIPKTFKIKIDGFPVKEKPVKTNWHNIISFGTGTILCISETMPFIDNEYNGILHALSKIQQEYKNDFK